MSYVDPSASRVASGAHARRATMTTARAPGETGSRLLPAPPRGTPLLDDVGAPTAHAVSLSTSQLLSVASQLLSVAPLLSPHLERVEVGDLGRAVRVRHERQRALETSSRAHDRTPPPARARARPPPPGPEKS